DPGRGAVAVAQRLQEAVGHLGVRAELHVLVDAVIADGEVGHGSELLGGGRHQVEWAAGGERPDGAGDPVVVDALARTGPADALQGPLKQAGAPALLGLAPLLALLGVPPQEGLLVDPGPRSEGGRAEDAVLPPRGRDERGRVRGRVRGVLGDPRVLGPEADLGAELRGAEPAGAALAGDAVVLAARVVGARDHLVLDRRRGRRAPVRYLVDEAVPYAL